MHPSLHTRPTYVLVSAGLRVSSSLTPRVKRGIGMRLVGRGFSLRYLVVRLLRPKNGTR